MIIVKKHSERNTAGPLNIHPFSTQEVQYLIIMYEVEDRIRHRIWGKVTHHGASATRLFSAMFYPEYLGRTRFNDEVKPHQEERYRDDSPVA